MGSDWVAPAIPGIDVFPVRHDSTLDYLREATAGGKYWFFFEPTPHPGIPHEPIRLCKRLSQIAPRPERTVAFVTILSPTKIEAQIAFAAQAGMILDVIPRVQEVVIRGVGTPGPTFKGRDAADDGGRVLSGRGSERARALKSEQEMEWARALNDAASRNPQTVKPLADRPALFARLYLSRGRGQQRFPILAREILHAVAIGNVPVRAADLARELGKQPATVQRAIRSITNDFPVAVTGRGAPEVVGQLVNTYYWFLHVNEP